MLINTDLSADTAALAAAQNRTETASSASATPGGQTAASQLDASLQSLTRTPVDVQDADWAIEDEAGADKATTVASYNILQQPGTALAAQGNQFSSNVLSLLDPGDSTGPAAL